MGLGSKLNWDGGYTQTGGPLGTTLASGAWGQGGEPLGQLSFVDGTGAGQANCLFGSDFSIAAGATKSWDLKGGGGELDIMNLALAFLTVKLVLIEITTPYTGQKLRWGPQGVANAAQLWFQAATANFWEEVHYHLHKDSPIDGWALDATHKIVSLMNPGASPVAGKVRIIGTK